MLKRLLKKLGGEEFSDEFINACEFVEINPSLIMGEARLYSLIISSLSIMTYMITPWWLLISVINGLITYYYFITKPSRMMINKRLTALGQAPIIITLLSTSLELTHSLEQSFKIISNIKGVISKWFSTAYKESIINGKPIINSFNELISYWGSFSKPFKDGLMIINSALSGAGSYSDGVNVFFNELISELRNFLSKVKTHTLLLFSFGTILPLIIVSLTPLFSILSRTRNGYWLLIINLIIIKLYSDYIIKLRPPTFSQLNTKLPKGKIIESVIIALIIGSPSLINLVGLIIGFTIPLPIGFHATLLIGIVAGITYYSWSKIRSVKEKRLKALRIEDELLDTIYSIGIKLRSEVSFEHIIKKVINESKNELTIILRKAYEYSRELKENINETIIRLLSNEWSQRALSLMKLVIKAISIGVNGSSKRVLLIYEHYNKMINAESEHKALINQVLSMIKLTIIIFAPIIGSFIIIMQHVLLTSINNNEFFTINNNLDTLILILGLYIIMLVIILTDYLTKINYGPDNVRFLNELIINLPASLGVYLSGIIIGLLLI